MDLKSKSRKELLELKAAIEKRLGKLEKEERKEALLAAQEAARAHGFSLDELTGAKPAKPARAKAPAKYRDPESGKEWSGRGRRPAWLVGVEDLSAFAIS